MASRKESPQRNPFHRAPLPQGGTGHPFPREGLGSSHAQWDSHVWGLQSSQGTHAQEAGSLGGGCTGVAFRPGLRLPSPAASEVFPSLRVRPSSVKQV